MDPVPFTPPEVLLDYEDPVHTQSGSLPFCRFPPRCHQHQPAELTRTDGSASQKPATVAEMLRSTAANTPQTQTASNQTPIGPVQHQGSPSFLHFLTGLSPSSLSLPDFPPDPPQMGLSPVFQELLFTPCSPQDPVWLNVSPLSVSPDSRFGGVSPCVLVPVRSPTETWFGADSPAHFRLPHQPHFCPSWCLCPENIPVHQPCAPGLLSSRAESAASGREQSGEPCKSGGQRSKIYREEEKKHKDETPAREKPPAGDGVNKATKPETTKPETSPTVPDPLDEESLANYAFEDYMSIMDALSPEIQENEDTKAGETEEERDGEEEKLDEENSLFLEYLDELCKDEEFVKKVGLMLDAEYLESLLSSSLDPIDLLALEEQVASTLNTEDQTDSFLSPDLDVINFIPLKEQEPETLDQPSLFCSRLLPSHLLEETPGSREDDGFPLPGEPLHHDGSLFMNYTVALSLPSPAETSPDTGPASDLTAGDGDALVAATFPAADGGQDESKDATVSLENPSDDQSAQSSQELHEGSLPGDHLASESPSSWGVSGSPEDPHQDPALGFGASSLTDSPPQSTGPPALRFLALKTLNLLPPPPDQMREAEEHHRPPNPESFTNPPEESDDTNNASPALGGLSLVEDSCDPQTDDDRSGSVPENQTVEPPEGPQVPQESETLGDVSELGTGEQQETNCETDLEKGVGTSLTQKPNEENRTIEKKENKETKPIRRSRRRSDRRVFGERKTETEERIKKTAELTPERDGAIHEKERPHSGEKQLCETEESRGTNVINPERSGETTDEKQGQKLAGDQREADGSDGCAETGSRDDLSTKTRQYKTSKEEAVRVSRITRRRTRSETAEGKVRLSPVLSPSTRAREKLKRSETQKSETKSPPEGGVKQEVNLQENVTGAQTLPVLSPEKRSRSREDEEKSETVNETHSGGCEDEEEASSSLPSPRAQTDTESVQDSKEDQGSLEESPLNERDEQLSAKTCERQMKTANDGDKRHDFYSLRSTTRNTRPARKSEKPDTSDRRGTRDDKAARRLSEPRDTSPDKINEEDHGVASSPMKRQRRQGGNKAELESEGHTSSPTKRARRKKTEAKSSERDEKQTGSETCDDEADEADASARGKIKEEFAKKDEGGRRSRDERSREETRKDGLSCSKRVTRLSVKLPTKYEDFILSKPKRKRQTTTGRTAKKDGKRKKRK